MSLNDGNIEPSGSAARNSPLPCGQGSSGLHRSQPRNIADSSKLVSAYYRYDLWRTQWNRGRIFCDNFLFCFATYFYINALYCPYQVQLVQKALFRQHYKETESHSTPITTSNYGLAVKVLVCLWRQSSGLSQSSALDGSDL